jgi:hypothetical protein
MHKLEQPKWYRNASENSFRFSCDATRRHLLHILVFLISMGFLILFTRLSYSCVLETFKPKMPLVNLIHSGLSNKQSNKYECLDLKHHSKNWKLSGLLNLAFSTGQDKHGHKCLLHGSVIRHFLRLWRGQAGMQGRGRQPVGVTACTARCGRNNQAHHLLCVMGVDARSQQSMRVQPSSCTARARVREASNLSSLSPLI